MLLPLKLKRLERGLSQYALSLLCGVSQVKICYAEKGYPALNPRQKDAIAKVFDCSITELFPVEQEEKGKTWSPV
jgi:transcriptional regulator with XRE-family HTH domain